MTTVDDSVKQHAKFSASGSAKWLACPGSVSLAQRAPPSAESPYALEGTQAHSVLEVFLKNGLEKVEASRKMLVKSNPMEMVGICHETALQIWKRVPPGAKLLCEQEVDFSFDGVDAWGTSDAIIVEDFGTLQVIDFKYGAGYAVDAVNNSQMICYAVGAAREHHYNFDRVEMVIIQPRAEHFSGETIRTWSISIEELMEWEKKLHDGIKAALDPFASFAAGDHCRWCSAKPICPALSDAAFSQAEIDFAPAGEKDIVLPAVQQIPNLSRVLKAADLIEEWIKGVRSHAQHVLETGGRVDGFKLVAKKAQRTWVDIDITTTEALQYFGGNIFTEPELLSPAQFEKKFKRKDWVDSRTTKVSSGVTMVDDGDPRPSVNPVLDDFGDSDVAETIDITPAVKSLPDAITYASTKKPQSKVASKARNKRR